MQIKRYAHRKPWLDSWTHKIIALIALLVPFGLMLLMVRECTNGVPVLNYHQVNDEEQNMLTVPTASFKEQMEYLHHEGYNTITPDQLYEHVVNNAPLPDKPILITFDDGYEDNYRNAFPVLKQYNMTATIFLVTDYMERFDNYLTWPHIQEMSDYGIYFGSHTLSHEELAPLSSHESLRQLRDSKSVIEWRTLKWVEYVAFPCGTFTDDTLKQALAAGYKGGFTVRYDLTRQGDFPFDMNRVPVFGHTNPQHDLLRFKLRLKLAPIIGIVERTKVRLSEAGFPNAAKWIITP